MTKQVLGGGCASENPAIRSRRRARRTDGQGGHLGAGLGEDLEPYWMHGGTDYYPVDKQAGDTRTATLSPGVFDLASSARAFLIRAVRYTASDLGVRQFLDCGSGLPSHSPTHEVAQAVAPESRIVYVDHDPLVLAHARALLESNPRGGTDYIEADLYDPANLLSIARTKLDFTQPVAIMLMGVMGHIGNPREDDDRADWARRSAGRRAQGTPCPCWRVLRDRRGHARHRPGAARGAGGIQRERRHPVLRAGTGAGHPVLRRPGTRGTRRCPDHTSGTPDPGTVNPPVVPAYGGIGRKP